MSCRLEWIFTSACRRSSQTGSRFSCERGSCCVCHWKGRISPHVCLIHKHLRRQASRRRFCQKWPRLKGSCCECKQRLEFTRLALWPIERCNGGFSSLIIFLICMSARDPLRNNYVSCVWAGLMRLTWVFIWNWSSVTLNTGEKLLIAAFFFLYRWWPLSLLNPSRVQRCGELLLGGKSP